MIAAALVAALAAGGAAAQQAPVQGGPRMPQNEMMQQMPQQRMQDAGQDSRQLLKLSPQAVDALRGDMRHMTASFAQVLALLAEGKREAAAKALEEGLGMSAMSSHPGMMKAAQEMPESARMLGMGMHKAASELAAGMKDADQAKIFAGLQQVSAGCTSCHMSYRVR